MMLTAVSVGWVVGANNYDRKGNFDPKLQYFPDLGHASNKFFSGKEISCATIENSICSTHGVYINENELVLESTILGLYPRMQGSKYEENYIIEINPSLLTYEQGEALEEAAYCMNEWDHNYQHFIIETLPKIHLAYLKTTCPIILMDCEHIREIVLIAYPNRDFIFLKKNSAIKVRCLHLPMPVAQNFEPVVQLQVFALLNLRERLAYPVPKPAGNVYLARANIKGMAGQHRRMVNDSDVLGFFKQNDVDIDDFSGKTLPEKLLLASRYINSFTPIGANLINYLFTQNEVNLYVISHPYFTSHAYFIGLFEAMKLPINYHVIPAGIEAVGEDNWIGQLNSPFRIDLNILSSHFNLVNN